MLREVTFFIRGSVRCALEIMSGTPLVTWTTLNHSSRLLEKPRVHFDPQPEVVEFQEEAEYEPILPGSRGGSSTITF